MAAEEAKKGGKGKLIGIVGGVLALAAGGYFFLMGGGGDEVDAESPPPEAVEVAEGAVIEADTMTVNLADEDTRYAKVTFAVVLPEGGDSATVGERMPLLKDAALQVLSEYTAADLKGQDGLDKLRGDLTLAAADVYTEDEVLRVVLTEVLVQ